jgi:hypothetical protein
MIEDAIDTAEWVRVPVPADEENTIGVEFYQGSSGGWLFNIAAFDIENQGFPRGSRGYDGATVRAGIIVRLTREQAQRAVERAKTALSGP